MINNTKNNVIGIVIGMTISWVIAMSTNLPESSGHIGFIPIIYPPIAAVFFIGLYLVSRLFTKKYNWIVSVFAIIHLLYFATNFYITENI